MIRHDRRRILEAKVLPYVQSPAQYVGGERNIVVKDHREMRGKLCLGFPDAYTIGMSHHGLQVLYALMNRREDWCAERVFTPWHDMESRLRQVGIPLSASKPLPHCAISMSFDVMVIGDGEPALPALCDAWIEQQEHVLRRDGAFLAGIAGCRQREDALAEIAAALPWAYVARFYRPEYHGGRIERLVRLRPEVPETIAPSVGSDRSGAMTLAPEVARDDMREQIRKKIKNSDLVGGCRVAFQNGFTSVKLYFLIGLPGEREVDLDGIVDLAEQIATIGREVKGRFMKVTASVSNFVPKSYTPYQWNAMQSREYFQWAHHYLWRRRKIRSVNIKCHDIETSLLKGVLSRGDRRTGKAIRLAWERGARMDGWHEHLDAARWWQAIQDAGIDVQQQVHEPYDMSDKLPWDHVNVKFGRAYLQKEQSRSSLQLSDLATAESIRRFALKPSVHNFTPHSSRSKCPLQ